MFLLASLTRKQKFTIFNTILFWFLNQSRHLQIEVGVGGADDFDTWSHLEQKKKNKKDCRSVCSWLRPELKLNIIINDQQNGGLVNKT